MTRLAVVLTQILDPKPPPDAVLALAGERLTADGDAKALFDLP